MPSSQFAKITEDPPNLYFKKPDTNFIKFEQDIRHFRTQGYTSLMDCSPSYGCLIFGIKNTLNVYSKDKMH